jgi:hypothetical protein
LYNKNIEAEYFKSVTVPNQEQVIFIITHPVTPSINCLVQVTPLPGNEVKAHFGRVLFLAN